MTIFNIIILYPQGEKALKELKEYEKEKENENTKRKHLKLCLLLLFMVLGCFMITNVRTTTVSADDETSDIPG